MMITIDPAELIAASETLRTCSIEAADIGSQLWSSAQFPMTADIQGVVDQLVVAVDRALDSVAGQLIAQAIDLTNRALIAMSDSLSSTTVVGTNSTPTSMTAAESIFGGTMTIGGTNPLEVSIGGWSAYDGMTVTSGGVTTAVSPLDGLYPSTMTIGGWSANDGITITSPDGTIVDESELLPSVITIGPPNYAAGSASGTMALFEAAQNLADRGNYSGASALFGTASMLQDSNDYIVNRWNAPLWSDLDIAAGRHLSESEVRSISEFSLPSIDSPVWPS